MTNLLVETKTKVKISKSKAFTLIEILLSLAMIAILTGATLQVVKFADTQKSLIMEADRFRSIIREAQSYSLAIPNSNTEHICGFGVYVNNDALSYQPFYTYATNWDNPGMACDNCLGYDSASASCNVDTSADPAIILSDGMSFTDGVDEDIFFKVPYGEALWDGASFSGEASFEITNGSRAIGIGVNELGKVE